MNVLVILVQVFFILLASCLAGYLGACLASVYPCPPWANETGNVDLELTQDDLVR